MDDTDIFVTGNNATESIQSVTKRAQNLINHWTHALWASGGCLRPNKCWFYAVNFIWEGSDWKYQNMNEMNIDIKVPDVKGDLHSVRQINFDQPETTLGVSIRVDGGNSGIFNHLQKKSQTWADQMKSAFLYRFEAVLSLMTTISKTWSYPLLVSTLSWDECEAIMLVVYDVIISKMGINKKLPRIFRFAPTSIGGLGLPHLYIMQGIILVIAILNRCNRLTQIGGIIVAQIELACLEIGTGTHLFSLPFESYE